MYFNHGFQMFTDNHKLATLD